VLPCWRSASSSVSRYRSTRHSVWWTQAPTISNLLVGWTGGPSAEKLIGLSREQLRRSAFESLAMISGLETDQVAALFIRDWFHDWANDPFALGAYSYPRVGGLRAAKILAEPIDDTLFFAGEATDVLGFNGTVHGAIETGRRAAGEILG
jgi:monoamine oxidase